MSSQIDVARSQQFGANVFILSQQKGSRLRGAVRTETQKGKAAFYDRIGSVTSNEVSGRHADTVLTDTPHSRRMVTMKDYALADMIDDQDKIRMLIDPQSAYVQAHAFAHGRKMDSVLLAAAVGSAYAGEAGGSATSLGTGQQLVPISSGAITYLNVAALRMAKKIIDASDVDPSIPRYCAVNAIALYSLLGQTEVTSSDYNNVKALVQGEVDTFLGFKFIRTELLPTSASFSYDTTTGLYSGAGSATAGTEKSCVCWAQDGLLLAVGADIQSSIDKRPDKNGNTQVLSKMSIGATRMEEAKVVEIICKQ
jgi:hypothetical protein